MSKGGMENRNFLEFLICGERGNIGIGSVVLKERKTTMESFDGD